MAFTCVVLYNNNLAYYTISNINNNTYTAYLLSYYGENYLSPPQKLQLLKEGNYWQGTEHQELISDLGYKIELRKQQQLYKKV